MIESTSTFFRLSQDLLCVTNSEGLLLEVNPAWQHVLGWASSDLVHQPFMDFVHPEDREGTITQAGLVAKSGVCAKHENRIRHKDGSYRQVLWTGAYDLSSKNFYGAARDITEQVSSYQQLKNTQRQLEAVFNSMLEGVVVQNGKGEVIHYNQTALKITGLSDEQMLGNTAQHPRWNIINESGQKIQASQHPASLARATGRPQTNQIIGICNAGAPTKWVCITAVPLFNAGDLTPYQIVVTFRDITEEKSARDLLQSMSEKLAKRKRFLKATLNSLPSLVSYVDQNLVYQYVNRAYENWFSVSSREIIGKTVEQFTGPAVFEFLKPKLSAALLGEQQDFETLAPYRLGGTRTVRVSYIPDISESGQAQGVYAIVHDVTAQIEAQSLLRKKDLEVIKLLNSIPALIGHWDRNLINRHANEVYSDYFGKTPAEIKGQHIQDVLGRELYEKNKPYIQGVLRGETQIFEREIPIAKGGTRHTLSTYIPDIVEGEVQGFYVVATDISELKKLERERQNIEAKLVSASKMSSLGEMAGGIAHEINNPLTIIQGNAYHLRKAGLDPKVIETIGLKIEMTVQRISKIIKSLQVFARESEGEEFAFCDLNSILMETLEFCRERFKNHNIELKLPKVDSNLKLECGRVQLSQVLLNLLNNAHDAVENLSERWVQIEVKELGAEIEISVTDSGTGVPAEIRDRLFQPFFSTKEVGKGTGLGLSVSKGIIDVHHGQIFLDPRSPNTRFIIRLPKEQKKMRRIASSKDEKLSVA